VLETKNADFDELLFLRQSGEANCYLIRHFERKIAIGEVAND